MKNPLKAAWIALVYGISGAVWIVSSDWLTGRWEVLGGLPHGGQTAKGLLFIAVTTLLLYALITLIERRLERERAWYRELFESNPQPMWVYDLETLRFLAVNNAAVRHYGYSREEFLSMTIADIRPAEEVSDLMASVKSARDGAEHHGIWRHRRKDGGLFRVEVFSHTSNFLGRRSKMVLIQDVTARLEAEEKLRESESRLRMIVEHEPESVAITTPEGIVTEINPAGVSLVQADDAAQILGHPVESFVHSGDRGSYLASRATVLALRKPSSLKFRVVGLRGALRWVEKSMVPLPDASGRIASLLCVARDVTEAHAAQEALRESENRFREMAENTGDIFYNYDPVNDRLLYANHNYSRIWGRPLAEAYANPMSYLDGIHPEDRAAAREADRRQRAGEPTETEYRVVRPDGAVTWIQDRSRSLRDASGRVYRIVGTMRDVSARRRAEDALRESQVLSRMAARVSRLGGWAIDLSAGKPAVTWSDEVCALHGVTPGFRPDLNTALKFYVPEHRPRIYRAIERCIKGGNPFDEELEITTRHGRRIAVRAMGEAVADAQGKIVRVQGALQDVTERKEAEHSLLQSQRRFFQLADSMPFMVWTADANGRVDFANAAFTEYTGIPSDEHLGEKWPELMHPDDLEGAAAVWAKAAVDGEPYESEFRLLRQRDAAYRWHKLTGTAIRDDRGHVVKWYGTALDVHEIKDAEKRARHLAQRLTKTLESITDAFLTLDAEWRFTYVNREAERVLGRRRDDLLGRDMWTEFPGAAGSDFERNYRHAVESGETVAFEAYYPPPLDKWFAVRAYPSAQGLVVYFRDVTQSRKADRLQRENEERLRLVTRATNDLIWDYDAVTGTIWWGEGFENFFGPAPENRVTDESFWEERVHPDDRERAVTGIETAFRGVGQDWSDEYRIRREDGTWVHVLDRGFVMRDEEGRATRMIGGLTDLTERKRAEEDLRILARELERERAKLVAAQAVAKLGNWETDLETHAVEMSAQNYRIYGLDPKTFAPSHEGILALIHPDDRPRVEQAFAASVAAGDSGMIAHRVVLPDRSIRYVEQNWRIERDAEGRPLRAVGTTQDITTRAALEEQFRQAQKMEAVGRLAGGVAHDFNNMLTVILVRAEQAARRLAPADPLRAGLKEIQDAASRSAGLTRQLLAYARRQTAEPRVVNLNESIGAMQGMLQRLIGEGIALQWIPESDLWLTRLDPVQVDQVLANLCVNARDAIRDVGRIVVETRNAILDEEYCRNHSGYRPGEYVSIAVSDNGTGMDAETRAHIFEPFFTTKETGKGTGLGLATVYGIVQQNDGFIHVYSEPGEGTTFRIYFPRHRDETVDASAIRPAGPPRGAGQTVLVVEDESMILEATTEILRGLGYASLATTSPEEALGLAESHAGPIHLLLTDVIMPGMNGRDLAERVKTLRPGIRVLYMSGYTANVIQHRGLVGQGNAFLQKPFATDELADRVHEVLAVRGGPDDAGSVGTR